MTKAKRIISVLLVLAMSIGLFPALAPRANAAMPSTVYTWDGLVSALTASIDYDIDVMNDIYIESESGFSTVEVKGNKTLDLNGYKIEYCYKNNKADPEMSSGNQNYLFSIPSSATLTINDSGNKGSINFTAHFHGAKSTKCIPIRDLFLVRGKLVINGGQITAGKQSGDWTTAFNNNGSLFTGTINRQIFGSVAVLLGHGELVVNGGILTGRGTTYTNNFTGGLDTSPVVQVFDNGTVTVNGGTFHSYCGADVFEYADGAPVYIYGGTFETHDTKSALVLNDYVKLGNIPAGYFGIRNDSWRPKYGGMFITFNDKFYSTYGEKNTLFFYNEQGKLNIDSVIHLETLAPGATAEEVWNGYTKLDSVTIGTAEFNSVSFNFRSGIDAYYKDLGYDTSRKTEIYKNGTLLGAYQSTNHSLSDFVNGYGVYRVVQTVSLLNLFDEEIGHISHEYSIIVLAPKSLETVNASVDIPRTGATPDNASVSTEKVTATATQWFQVNTSSETALGSSSTFANGVTYRAYVALAADPGFKFTESTKTYINGSLATLSYISDNGSNATYYVTYTVDDPHMDVIGSIYVPTPGMSAADAPPSIRTQANFNYEPVFAVWTKNNATFTGNFVAGQKYVAKFRYSVTGLTSAQWDALTVDCSADDFTYSKTVSNGKYYLTLNIPINLPSSRYVIITDVNPPLEGDTIPADVSHTFSAANSFCNVRDSYWTDSEGNTAGTFEEGKVYTANFLLQVPSSASIFPIFTASVNGQVPTELSRSRLQGYVSMEFVAQGVCYVYYDLKDGQGNLPSDKVVKGETYTLAGTGSILAPSGKTFSHWDVNGTAYDAGSVITLTEDVYVTAVWKPASTEVIFTKDSSAAVGGKMTVDIEAMAEMSDVLMEAYFNNNVTYQWYKNDSPMSGATASSLSFTADHALSEFCVVVSFGDTSLTSRRFWVLAPAESESTSGSVTRIFGNDRYETAFDVADQLKEDLQIEKFDAVIVSSGTQFADALSGSYLAAVKNAPILLVRNNNKTIAAVKEYINENLAAGGTVYLLGGPVAVPKSMESGLSSFTVKRLGGATRYETNLLILEEAGVGNNDILVCTGLDFADSLSASAAKRPILLVKNSLTNDQKALLASSTGTKYIIGGTAAVPARVETQLSAYGTVKRLGGATRYDTSVLVAQEFFSSPDKIVVAYARDFPDGLSGAPLAIANNAPLILTNTGKQAAAVSYASSNGIVSGYVLGGTRLISDAAVRSIFSMSADGVIAVR